MNDTLIILLSDIFFQQQKKGNDPYRMIKFSVPLKSLNQLYEKLIKVDVPAIETLPEADKIKYWNLSKQYHTSEIEAVMGAKAAYILSLITSS